MASLQTDSNSASLPNEELSKLRHTLLAIGGNALQPTDEHELANASDTRSAHVTARPTAMDGAQTSEANHFPDGDTQPMESQIYREYSKLGENGYTYDTARQSQQVEQTGDMNLLEAWPDDLPTYETQEHGADNEDYADLLETQQTGDIPRFPQTPAIAGQKHARNGDLLTSATTTKQTPMSQLFGGNGKTMTATQMFAQTQEPSSPFHGDVVSDPVSSRPSPNVQQQLSTSSPQLATPHHTRSASSKTFPEPRGDYRAIRLSPIPASPDEYDDSDDEIPRPRSSRSNTATRKGMLKARPPFRTFKSANQIDLTKSTPATVRKGQHDFDLLQSPVEEDVAIINEEDDFIHDPNVDDDVYDEHSQAVIKSSGPDDVAAELDEEQQAEHPETEVKNSSLQEEAVPNSQVVPSQPAGDPVDAPTQVTATSLVLGTQCHGAPSQPVVAVENADSRVPSSPPQPLSEIRQEITESNNALFSTAQSHVSSRKSPSKPTPSPSQLVSQQSIFPRRRANVSHRRDIEAENDGQDDLLRELETIDEVMDAVITEDDHKFLDIFSSPKSPARKKARVTYASARRQTAKATTVPSKSLTEEGTVLRESPSKANELLEHPPIAEETQPSAKKRERAGAHSVSQLVSNRGRRKAKPKGARKKAQATTAPALDHNVEEPAAACEEHETVAQEQILTTNLVEREVPAPGQDEKPTTEQSMEKDTGAGPVVAPQRVLALYGLNYQKYYTATWLGRGEPPETYKVKFDDGRIADVKVHQVVSLDLRIGDVVKLEAEKGSVLYNKEVVIRGFGPVAKTEDEKAQGTDRCGRLLAHVELKTGKAGLIDAMINHIKIDHNKFKHFLDRRFIPPSETVRKRAETPTAAVDLSMANTPNSRTRRGTHKWSSHFREGSTDSRRTKSEPGIFEGMAFSFSGIEGTKASRLTNKIRQNGGLILDKGLNELFEIPTINSVRASSDLTLKPEHENLGFVALITDSHSRRAKYIEALALGIPALSSRFITDSLEERSALPSWSKYLLAAGESAYLGGAVRSRQLADYRTTDARLSKVVLNRVKLLSIEDGVLVVPPPKSSPYYKNRLDIVLYLQALRPGRVRQVGNLSEAATLLKQEPDPWNWIHIAGPASVAAQTLSLVGSKKRKRADVEEAQPKVDAKKVQELCRADYLCRHGQVKVVNDEFVIQSLIFGTLVG